MCDNIKPPIGLKPLEIHNAERYFDIAEAVLRYSEIQKPIPNDWVIELAALSEYFKARQLSPANVATPGNHKLYDKVRTPNPRIWDGCPITANHFFGKHWRWAVDPEQKDRIFSKLRRNKGQEHFGALDIIVGGQRLIKYKEVI